MADLDTIGLGMPALLVGAVVIIGIAALILHFLFPPAGRKPRRRSGLSRVSKRCPSCREKLDEVEQHGIRMDVCPCCQGVWLSPGKLDQIVG